MANGQLGPVAAGGARENGGKDDHGSGPRVPSLEGGGRVCPDDGPFGTWVRSVLEQREREPSKLL